MSRLSAVLRELRPPPLRQALRPPLRTGICGLDDALGGGLPAGQLVTLHGAPGSGKTTLALRLCRAAQSLGEVAYLDADCGLHPSQAAAHGIVMPRFLYAAPPVVQVAPMLAALVAAGLPLVVVELAAGWPAGAGALRRLRWQAAASGTTVLFTTQHGSRPTVCWGDGLAIPPGADALAFCCTQRLRLEASGALVRVG